MRKRKRARYTWMPTLGGVTENTAESSAWGTSMFGFEITPEGDNAVPTAPYVTPIVPDETFFPDSASAAGSTLRDFTEGQDWILKRIVGKIHLNTEFLLPNTAGLNWPMLYVAAAFFVGRAHDDNKNVPDLDPLEYDPLSSQNIRQPWIWRRTWWLDTGAAIPTNFAGLHINRVSGSNFAFANSALDGPHLDAKSARRIRREERLWFVCNAQGFVERPGQAFDLGNVNTAKVDGALDYRIVGAMRKSNNRSTF